jgi:hypothetical protein
LGYALGMPSSPEPAAPRGDPNPRALTPHVRFVLPDGRAVDVPPGGILGRMPSATLRLDDPRVSEAHALLSLRGRGFRLLALRGLLQVGKAPTTEVALAVGQVVRLAPDLALTVSAIALPESLLAVASPGQAPQELSSPVYSLLNDGALVGRYEPDASAHLWSTSEGWMVRAAGGEPAPLQVGTFTVGQHTLTVREIPLAAAAVNPTLFSGRFFAPVRIITNFDIARIEIEGRELCSISGHAGRILCELAAVRGPVNWEIVAGEIWDGDDRHTLRQSWDRALGTLRGKLRLPELRPDLVRADGHGHIELFLQQGDEIEDRG